MPVTIAKETDSLFGGLFLHANNRTLYEWRHHGRIELNYIDVAILAVLGAVFAILSVLLVLQLCCCLKRCVRRKGSAVDEEFSTFSRGKKTAATLPNLAFFVDSEYKQLHNKVKK